MSKDFDKVYKKYIGLLLHITDSFYMTRESGEEIVHDVFINYIQKQHELEPDKVKSFLVVTTRNRCIDYFRKCKYRKTDIIGDIEEAGEQASIWDNDEQHSSILRATFQAMKTVGEKPGCREFRKYYVEESSIVEIANQEDLPHGTIKARIHRCRKKYAQLIRSIISSFAENM